MNLPDPRYQPGRYVLMLAAGMIGFLFLAGTAWEALKEMLS